MKSPATISFKHFNKIFLSMLAVVVLTQVLLISTAKAVELPDFTKLVEQNSAAVVNISTTQKIKRAQRMPHNFNMPNMPKDSPFGDLFRHFFGEGGNGGNGGMPQEFKTQSLGSGFIIDADGYVVTNYHVIKDADEIVVKLSDRRELKAKVIGSDERSDMALLKIDADDLPVVKIGKSSTLKVGEWALAIGSPFGFDHSVSVGVISAIGRNLPSENYVPFIQTDVAINPGNSGGPLFNLKGQVIGINSQIYSRTGGFMGLSFAIPIDVAMDVVAQLKDKGKVARGWLGILIQDVNRKLAESFGMTDPRGAVVLQVVPDSPAAKAGFKVGDVIIEFNGKKIIHSSDLPLAVGQAPIDVKARVKLIREGKTKTLSVIIAELPSKDVLAENNPAASHKGEESRLGLVVEDLTDEQRERLGLGKRGIIVRDVEKGPAREAGIHRGDVVLMLDSQDINNIKQFKTVVAGLKKGKSTPVLIQRGNAPLFLPLKIPK
ncbi:HtrA protease/chaperone protein [hydrothermal vent metagenome]|uniref:Probable periplasmic serine endoprotease DegP-like n=1 Tax=hydrothermal vent metagenome TaxID=652676 RepID=A0A3B1B855_9ZZZZ